MGWVGAQRDGSLLKYAEFLAGQGYPTLRSVQPTPVAFAPLDLPRRRWALAMLRCLEGQGLWPQRQLVLYSFSNGGAFVVEQLMLLAEADPRCAGGLLPPTACAVLPGMHAQLASEAAPPHPAPPCPPLHHCPCRCAHLPSTIAGFIFDSAPAYMLPGGLQRVLGTAEPPSLSRWLKMRYYEVTTRLRPHRYLTFWANMERLDWGKPFLFLYSRDDALCSAGKLDELVAEKRARGQDVAGRRWERSEHVAHFRHHRQEYAALLLHFLGGLKGRGREAAAGQPPAAAAEAAARSRL